MKADTTAPKAPYEVRGGVALPLRQLWAFIQDVQKLEIDCFGDALHKYASELKGTKLLKKKRLRFAGYDYTFTDEERRKKSLALLNAGREGKKPRQIKLAAYGQASIKMVDGVFSLLERYDAKLFDALIPRAVKKPEQMLEHYLRKDFVYLLERFFDFLEQEDSDGMIVMDETEKQNDRQFIKQMQRYFTRTIKGQKRSKLIMPVPFFVSSDLAYPIQIADICIYCINWGFRKINNMVGEVRQEIQTRYENSLYKLQVRLRDQHSIVHIPKPYQGSGR